MRTEGPAILDDDRSTQPLACAEDALLARLESTWAW
jgi:hypothetical protein